ncbi:MAG: integron integrase [Nitrospirae bacterium]|nr:integron integrase [Nitrospirota bacterium]
MLPIPEDDLAKFNDVLKQRRIPEPFQSDYRKWLRYFLDFCSKYQPPDSRSDQVRLFIEKLQKKNQTPEQQKQAAHALSLFFESQKAETKAATTTPYIITPPLPPLTLRGGEAPAPEGPLCSANRPWRPKGGKLGGVTITDESSHRLPKDADKPLQASSLTFVPLSSGGSRFNEWRCLEKSDSPEWDKLIDNLADEIKTRHYSRKTLKTYADWVRRFQRFLKSKAPDELSSSDVKDYLTNLAVVCRVASSTQNQAFNALLFLYRHILKKDFGEHEDIPRAKRSSFIPVVLSRQEIEAILKYLEHPYSLVVKLLYGCGLRLFECVKVRAQDFNFDAGILTAHGKGGKDRTVPIPQSIMPELTAQFEAIKKLHDEDLAKGYAGVFLEDRLEKKYPSAGKDFTWQWFFPQKSLTPIPAKQELRRYHLHESHVQEALYEAVRRARLTKRVTCHTFRHSFATHLLQANYDIRTIQTLLGHSDVRTTMIYTHCVPSRTIKETKSPLDF